MISCAGHDARFLSRVCTSGMVFIPCKDGISYKEKESAEPVHVAAAQTVSDVLLELAQLLPFAMIFRMHRSHAPFACTVRMDRSHRLPA